jgi:hypothetical protein
MNCTDSAEYVSALCDGEVIPSEAAKHIGQCTNCHMRLLEYLEMGAELRRTASLQHFEPVASPTWTKPRKSLTNWWQKGMVTMRIPRLAFVVLIGAIIALGSSLAVVKVRAHADGTVVLLSLSSPGTATPIECPLSTVEKNYQQQQCGFIGLTEGVMLGFKVRLLSRSDGRVELGVRARQWPYPGQSSSFTLEEVDRQPEQNYWFEPGDTLKIENPGMLTVTIKGAWLDHMPSFAGASRMDPEPDEIRILSPLLLDGKQVIGDMEGGSSTQTRPDAAVLIYFPKLGGYLIANSRIQDATEAQVALNRISFAENGRQYVFLTGAPVTRAGHVWVLHRPDFKGVDAKGDNRFISSESLRPTESGTWVPEGPMN